MATTRMLLWTGWGMAEHRRAGGRMDDVRGAAIVGCQRRGGRIRLARPQRFVSGTATYVHEGRLYVVNIDDTYFFAFHNGARTSDAGCRSAKARADSMRLWPDRSSIWRRVHQGPVTSRYGPLRVSLDGEELVVDTARPILDPTATCKLPDAAAQPSCLEES